jgi:hypothetical protein
MSKETNIKRIEVKLGEPFEVDNGRYISTWKMFISGGVLKMERQLNQDWERLEKDVDKLMENPPHKKPW